MGVFEGIDLIRVPQQASWDEFYSPEEGAYLQGIARQVTAAGLEEVGVAISEMPEEINPGLRRVTFTATENTLGLRAFQQARWARPQGDRWQPGEREAAVTAVIQRYARFQAPRG